MFHEPNDHPIVQTTGFRIGTGVSTSVSISLRNVSHYINHYCSAVYVNIILLLHHYVDTTSSFLWFSGVNGVTRHLVHGATVEYGFNSREQSFSRSHVSLWYGGHRWGSRMTVSRQNPRNALQRLLQPL